MSRLGRCVALLYVLDIVSPMLAADGAALENQCAEQITYKSDTDKAYKYLENLQRQIYTENPQLTDPFSRAQLNEPGVLTTAAKIKAAALKACPDPLLRTQCALNPDVVDEVMKDLRCRALATRFESPIFAAVIDAPTGKLDGLRVNHFPKSPVTRFGSLPTGTLDAQAILPPGSKVPLVILNRDIFFFTGLLSKAITDSPPITVDKVVRIGYTEPELHARLRDHPYIVHNFADPTSRLVREGSFVGGADVILDENHNHLHQRLIEAMELFVISHEEAHVILGHVSHQAVEFHLAGTHTNGTLANLPKPSAPESQTLSLPSSTRGDRPSTTLKAELRTREQELEADALGFRLMMWSEQEEGDPVGEMVAAAAPQMVFRVLDAANAYGSEAGGWTFSDANHPSADERIIALSPVFDEVAQTSEPLREVDFRITFDAAFKVLLEEADPEIRQNLGLKKKDIKQAYKVGPQ